MSDLLFGVSPQVREEAWKVADAELTMLVFQEQVDEILDAVIPVIAGAAYKEGLEEAKASIQAIEGVREAERLFGEGFEAGLCAALAAIDKEGEHGSGE